MVTFVWSSEQEEALHVQLRWKQPCLLVHMAQRQHGIRVVGETPFGFMGELSGWITMQISRVLEDSHAI